MRLAIQHIFSGLLHRLCQMQVLIFLSLKARLSLSACLLGTLLLCFSGCAPLRPELLCGQAFISLSIALIVSLISIAFSKSSSSADFLIIASRLMSFFCMSSCARCFIPFMSLDFSGTVFCTLLGVMPCSLLY